MSGTVVMSRGGRWQYSSITLLAEDRFVTDSGGPLNIGDIVLEQVSGFSTSASTRYFQVFDDVVPGLGSVPVFCVAVPAGQPFAWQPPAPGYEFGNTQLAYWGVSSTAATYTPSADTFWVQAFGRARVSS